MELVLSFPSLDDGFIPLHLGLNRIKNTRRVLIYTVWVHQNIDFHPRGEDESDDDWTSTAKVFRIS